jgi:hypothetical protein
VYMMNAGGGIPRRATYNATSYYASVEGWTK